MPDKLEITSMDMKPGTTLKLKGRIADGASSFTINLGQSADKLDLHFNPRFNESTIVCNSLNGGSWGQEQRDGHLCFSPGSEVKIAVAFQEDGFKVTLPDGHQLTFPNRLGHGHVSYLGVKHFRISSFKLG
ncbi:galectin-2 [Perognathus longimembris pacificus]|uniref:galectin-2 n=1 Tax=Perognathus longimembris pacificus TaxID=214514 RepID=UPI002019EAFE|nr:galectin-2 [Perognathus longimembris pacificus]